MRVQTLIALAFLVLSSGVARAEPPKTAPEDAVKLSPVALPIVADGRLVNYVFVSVKVLLTPQADTELLQTKEPYFRDALVRAAHRTPFGLRDDYNRIDEARLKAVMMQAASAIAGPGKVRGIALSDETPQHHLPPPGGGQDSGPAIVP